MGGGVRQHLLFGPCAVVNRDVAEQDVLGKDVRDFGLTLKCTRSRFETLLREVRMLAPLCDVRPV